MPFTGELAPPSPAEARLAHAADAVFQMLTGHWASQTIRAAAELHVTDHIAAGAQTAEEVARHEAADPKTTYRLMRACACLGLLGYEGGGRFSLTLMGQLLRAGVPGSLREAVLVQGARGHRQGWGKLPAAIRSGTNGIEHVLGVELWEYFSVNCDEAELFSTAMSNTTGQVIRDTVALLDLGPAERVVDVGGADGALLLALMEAHPHVEGVIFDLPHVVRSAWQAGLSDRLTTVGGDFFQGVPEADYYLLKWILHDWTDDECVAILRNIRAAARPGARALVIEALIGEIGQPGPAPLSDMNLLAITGGQERDLAEFDALFTASGWRRTALRPTHSLFTLIELDAI